MLYFIVIVLGDEKYVYGVFVLDILGCFFVVDEF